MHNIHSKGPEWGTRRAFGIATLEVNMKDLLLDLRYAGDDLVQLRQIFSLQPS